MGKVEREERRRLRGKKEIERKKDGNAKRGDRKSERGNRSAF